MANPVPPVCIVVTEIDTPRSLRSPHRDVRQRDVRQRDDGDHSSERVNKLVVLDELAPLNPPANLVLCGDEPMMDADDDFAPCASALERRLRPLPIVSATGIRRFEAAERTILETPIRISTSQTATTTSGT